MLLLWRVQRSESLTWLIGSLEAIGEVLALSQRTVFAACHPVLRNFWMEG
jgi:hypothetical protein